MDTMQQSVAHYSPRFLSMQENHELPHCYVMISVSFEQNWECLHTASHLPVNKHIVHTAAAEPTLLGPYYWVLRSTVLVQ